MRQGKKLSPLFILIFLNDLENYFLKNHVPGVKCEIVDNDIVPYFKFFLLLYADDTVIVSETPDDL